MFILRALLLIGLFTFTHSLTAQRHPPRIDVSAQLGLFPTFLSDAGRSLHHPVAVTAAYRLAPRFSLGVYAGTSRSNSQQQLIVTGPWFEFDHRYRLLALRPMVHTSHRHRWEVYGGLYLGISDSRITHTLTAGQSPRLPPEVSVPATRDGLFASAFVGVRCQLTHHLGLVSELGQGVSLLTVGLSYRR